MRTMATLEAPPRSDSIWPINALSLPSSKAVCVLAFDMAYLLVASGLYELCQYARGAGGAVVLDRTEALLRVQCGDHRLGDDVRSRCGVIHATSRPVAIMAMCDMEILLEMVLQGEIEKRRASSRQLHAGGKAALHKC